MALGDAFLKHRDDGGEDGPDRYRGEHGAILFGVEAVAGGEHQRDHREGHVQQRPGEGGPEAEEEDDRFGEHELERDREGEVEHVG